MFGFILPGRNVEEKFIKIIEVYDKEIMKFESMMKRMPKRYIQNNLNLSLDEYRKRYIQNRIDKMKKARSETRVLLDEYRKRFPKTKGKEE